MNTVRHNRHNSIGSGKTVETLDDDETGIDEGIEKERKEAGLYGGGFHLVDWTLGKLSSLKPLFENWEDCFVSAMGTHTHTNACTRIIKPTQTRDLGWRGGGGGRPNYFIWGGGGTGWRCAPLNPGSKVFRYEMELHNSLSECFINRDYSYLSPQCGRVHACLRPGKSLIIHLTAKNFWSNRPLTSFLRYSLLLSRSSRSYFKCRVDGRL